MVKKAILFILFSSFSSLLFAGLGVDVDLGIGSTTGNDDLYFRINAHYFDRDPNYVYATAKRLRVPDVELPIVLFLSAHSKKDVDFILQLHNRGLSWWDVSLRIGIPVSVYFYDLPYDPGPPYGKAYGHWKKHKRNSAHRIILTDREMYDLVSLQVACNYYGLPQRDVMRLRSEGRDFKVILSDEYRHRHVPPGHMKAKEKEKEHNKEHGHKK